MTLPMIQVERLRETAKWLSEPGETGALLVPSVSVEHAADLTALLDAYTRSQEALGPFARWADKYLFDAVKDDEELRGELYASDFRRARSALAGPPSEGETGK